MTSAKPVLYTYHSNENAASGRLCSNIVALVCHIALAWVCKSCSSHHDVDFGYEIGHWLLLFVV